MWKNNTNDVFRNIFYDSNGSRRSEVVSSAITGLLIDIESKLGNSNSDKILELTLLNTNTLIEMLKDTNNNSGCPGFTRSSIFDIYKFFKDNVYDGIGTLTFFHLEHLTNSIVMINVTEDRDVVSDTFIKTLNGSVDWGKSDNYEFPVYIAYKTYKNTAIDGLNMAADYQKVINNIAIVRSTNAINDTDSVG